MDHRSRQGAGRSGASPCSSTPPPRTSARPCWRRRSPPASTSIPRSRWRCRSSAAASCCSAAQARGVKHGAVEDKLGLPGLQKLAHVVTSGALGRIVGFRIEFGWWVFDGTEVPCQRPSWNYTARQRRRADPRYVSALALRDRRPARADAPRRHARSSTATPERIDETGRALHGRRRGHRLHHRRAGKRRDRHHPVVMGDAGAPRRPADLPDRRHQGLRHRRPAPLLDADQRADAAHRAFQHRDRSQHRLSRATGPR